MPLSRAYPAVFTCLMVFLSFCLPQNIEAQTSDSFESCAIIHNYESYCGNLEPQNCLQYRQSFDYWNNPEHQRAWDDFYRLCSQDLQRSSHECIARLGIGASCASTVAPRPEPVSAYRQVEASALAEQGTYVEIYRREERLCLRSVGTDAIENFLSTCGDVKADQCPHSGAVAEEFARWCGERSGCRCADELNCGSPQCPLSPDMPSAPEMVMVPDATPNAGTPAAPSPTTPTDTAFGSSEGVGVGNVSHAVENGHWGAGMARMSGSGCALQGGSFTTQPSCLGWALALFSGLAWRLRRHSRCKTTRNPIRR